MATTLPAVSYTTVGLPPLAPHPGANPAAVKPDTPSSDYQAMIGYWSAVLTVMEGADAMRQAGERFLPRFPNETVGDYEYRRRNAMFTNIYRDIVEGLAAKPFAKETVLREGTASTAITDLTEDIDGQGNNLHVFASQTFFAGINYAVDWILIDKAPVPVGASVADEKRIGARPYWVHIPAVRVLAVYSDMIDGQEVIVHARIAEPDVERVGFAEQSVNRIRVLERPRLGPKLYGPAVYRIYEEVNNYPGGHREWIIVEEGSIAIGVIALVPFIVGRRKGTSWQFVPPMQDALFLQLEHYQQETNLKSIKEQAAFPMLAGNGVAPDTDAAGNAKMVPVGPKTVLYAPPNEGGSGAGGSWSFIEPAATSMTFLAADVKATEDKLRELGRQPLTAQQGNITVISTAFAASKANSAIQAWALALKDALEQALMFTALWLGDSSEPEVVVHTDFALEMESQEAPNFLLALRKNNDISRATILEEAKRRNILSPDFDADEDQQALLNEQPAAPTAEELLAAANLPPGNPPPRNNLRVV
jgi:uncharacterized protein DUF4055